ncbi:MAG TPA: hypothetical protein VK665_12570, partial [Candidatus Elarobacter sp.]|nr:hypothetical protein [Candidatus Elarobacter sp.]
AWTYLFATDGGRTRRPGERRDVMKHRVIPLALLALLAAPPLAARADDAAAVRGKIAAAMQAAKSYVITTTASTGFTVTTTFVAPDRFHSSLAYGGTTRDVVLVGPVAYVSDGGRAYQKMDAPPAVIAAQSQLRAVPVDQVLSDKTVAGKTWGRFTTTAAGPEKDQRLTCTFDKATYRINDCSNEGMTLTFSRYDDPQNVVTIPAAGGAR